ncbi:MAG: hypothetical protein ACM3KR_05155 [Deltaproteobacteria bacterium]
MQNQTLYRINDDISSIFKNASDLKWNGIRENTLSRILYLSSVLYNFVYEDKDNPFSKDYNFSTDIRGPYCDSLEASLAFLLSNEYITKDEETGLYEWIGRQVAEQNETSDSLSKRDWIKIVIYILGIYGEEKIYDFVYRDPEYEDKLQTNVPEINLDKGNETFNVLIQFRNAFEKSIADLKKIKVEPKKYLELYFEYVFSTILKGEEA